MKIAFGPSTPHPSWKWCAADLIPDLQKHHEIQVFRSYSELSSHHFDMVMCVKQLPSKKEPLLSDKIVYLPIDRFTSISQIAAYSNFLLKCNVIAVHCARLIPHLSLYCKRIEPIEHYGKYVLSDLNVYGLGNIVLWTGMCKYTKPLYDWFFSRPRSFDITALTNRLASLPPTPKLSPTIRLHEWTEELQQKYFQSAKSGLDIKGSDFGQQTKPPTKIQQLIASGIPSAVNHNSYTWEYFHEKGFNLASPDDCKRWFSEDYWKETHDFATKFRESISKQSIVRQYLDLIATA